MTQFDDGRRYDIDGSLAAEPDRTSALAIASLVLACTCVLSPLGFIGGIVSLVLIGTSGGRVGGRGLSVAAIVVGGLLSMGLLGATFAVREGIGAFERQLAETGDLFVEVEAGDVDAVRARFGASAAERITEERLAAFRSVYTAEFGSFLSAPTDFSSYIEAFGQTQTAPPSGGNLIPVQLTFDGGSATVLFELSQTEGPKDGAVFPPLTDVVVMLPDGSRVSLPNMMLPGSEAGAGSDADPEAGDAGGEAVDEGEADDAGGSGP